MEKLGVSNDVELARRMFMAGDEDVVLPLNYRYCLLFYFSAAWFCLWSISLHLVERPVWRCCYFRLVCVWG